MSVPLFLQQPLNREQVPRVLIWCRWMEVGKRRERQCGPVATNLRGVWESTEGGQECSRTTEEANDGCTYLRFLYLGS